MNEIKMTCNDFSNESLLKLTQKIYDNLKLFIRQQTSITDSMTKFISCYHYIELTKIIDHMSSGSCSLDIRLIRKERTDYIHPIIRVEEFCPEDYTEENIPPDAYDDPQFDPRYFDVYAQHNDFYEYMYDAELHPDIKDDYHAFLFQLPYYILKRTLDDITVFP